MLGVFFFTGWCLQCFRIYTAEIRKKENRDNMWGNMNALTGWSSAGSRRGTARWFAQGGADRWRTTHTVSSSGCHWGPEDEIKVSNYIHTHDNNWFIIFLFGALNHTQVNAKYIFLANFMDKTLPSMTGKLLTYTVPDESRYLSIL